MSSTRRTASATSNGIDDTGRLRVQPEAFPVAFNATPGRAAVGSTSGGDHPAWIYRSGAFGAISEWSSASFIDDGR